MRNDILEAYNKGLRIRNKKWGMSEWIKKYSNTKSINSYNLYHPVGVWAFHAIPKYWEIFHEDVEPETPEPQTEIQQAIDLLKANGYEVYQITKTKL
jgi:hypothetical protein